MYLNLMRTVICLIVEEIKAQNIKLIFQGSHILSDKTRIDSKFDLFQGD